ncbi:tetraspanin-6-like [Dysidea avara]|uniref:tetraspanin-6-like n=1 Tax=Dysidea avara TaxID=196820 RepID=UPI00331E2189
MICRHGGLTFVRHNDLRDIRAELLSKVCNDVSIEPPLQSLSGEVITPQSANQQDDARADIYARGFWGQRQSAFFDIRVFHPNGQSCRNASIPSVYRRHEQQKKREYGDCVRESTDRDYLDISGNDDRYNNAAILLAIVGSFILIVGSTGIFGVFCASKLIGRILLGFYGVGMSAIILIASGGAIAGYVHKDKLEDTLHDDAYRTLNRTEHNKDYLRAWNDAQKSVHCCGVESFEDWLPVQWRNDTVGVIPVSCCAKINGCSGEYIVPGEEIVWRQGCADAIIDKVSDQIGAVAGFSIAILILMIIAVVMAFTVMRIKDGDTYEMV